MKQKFKYLKFSYIIAFFICQNSLSSFSQYYPTTAINLIDSLRLGKEGDLYLDTLNGNYNIGLSNGKLGSLSDKQDIDSISISNDSLFVHITNGKKAGISMDSIASRTDKQDIDSITVSNDSLFVHISNGKKAGTPLTTIVSSNMSSDERGLRILYWKIPNTNQPDLNNRQIFGEVTSTSSTLSPLNDSLHLAIANPFPEGYIIKFSGTLKVQNSGTFNFQCTSDDGARIYLDDEILLNSWQNQGTTSKSIGRWLAKGEHKISFWYYQDNGGRFMQFSWGVNPDGYVNGSTIRGDQFYIK